MFFFWLRLIDPKPRLLGNKELYQPWDSEVCKGLLKILIQFQNLRIVHSWAILRRGRHSVPCSLFRPSPVLVGILRDRGCCDSCHDLCRVGGRFSEFSYTAFYQLEPKWHPDRIWSSWQRVLERERERERDETDSIFIRKRGSG